MNSVSIVGLWSTTGNIAFGTTGTVPPSPNISAAKRKTRTESGMYEGSPASFVNWQDLLTHFKNVQGRHESYIRRKTVAREDSVSSEFRMSIPTDSRQDRRGSKLAMSPVETGGRREKGSPVASTTSSTKSKFGFGSRK